MPEKIPISKNSDITYNYSNSLGTDLPPFHMGHQISQDKMEFWAFLYFSLKFSPFFLKIRTFLFIAWFLGHFGHI